MITISPGHYGAGTGAKGYVDEFVEARKVSEKVHALLNEAGIPCHLIVDQTSKTQRENLAYLVRAHNETNRKLDVSIHFNSSAGGLTARPIGVEVLYVNPTYMQAAKRVSYAIAKSAGFIDRGAKRRTDLAILNGTDKPCLLVEVCFVNSKADVDLYRAHFDAICQAFAMTLGEIVGVQVASQQQPTTSSLFTFSALADRLQPYYSNAQFVEEILQKGIKDKVFQPVWLELWRKQKLTFLDFCGLCALLLCDKK